MLKNLFFFSWVLALISLIGVIFPGAWGDSRATAFGGFVIWGLIGFFFYILSERRD